jgi:hypothetical protein
VRIAGVRTAEGRAYWVDSGEIRVEPLDAVVVCTPDGEVEGEVFVAPEALVGTSPECEGTVVQVRARRYSEGECGNLPGADMPPLGSTMNGGTVIGVDSVNRTVIIRDAVGDEVLVGYPSASEP